MPYYRRRSSRRRRPSYRRRSSRRTSSRMIRSVVQRMAEKKLIPYQLMGGSTLGAISSAWNEVDVLSQIICGTDWTQRIGRKIQVTSLQFEGTLCGGCSPSHIADDPYNTIRMVVYSSRIPKTGTSLSPLFSASQTINSLITYGQVPTIHKYKDQLIILNNKEFAPGECGPQVRKVKWFLKFKKPFIVTYTHNTAVDYNQSQLFVSMISDSAVVPNPGFVNGRMTVRFTDI